MDETWITIAKAKFWSSVNYTQDIACEDFLDSFLKNKNSTEKHQLFDTLEIILKRVTPPDDSLEGSSILEDLWLEYYELCETKEYLLYYLEEHHILTTTPKFCSTIARLHIKKKEYVLADEWIRIGQQKFPDGDKLLEEVADELLKEAENGLKMLVWNLSQLYQENNWDTDPGIDGPAFERLFNNPILVRKKELNLKPAFMATKSKTFEPICRLSDSCSTEIREGATCYFIERAKREIIFGKRTMYARELAYRLIQISQNQGARHQAKLSLDEYATLQKPEINPDDCYSKFAFWMIRITQVPSQNATSAFKFNNVSQASEVIQTNKSQFSSSKQALITPSKLGFSFSKADLNNDGRPTPISVGKMSKRY